MLEQNLSLSLRSYISLRTQQSLKILSLNQVELYQEIKELLNENPFIEESKNLSTFEDDLLKWQAKKNNLTHDGLLKSYEFFDQNLVKNESISSVLLDQLKFMNCDELCRKVLLLFISDLDERGFTTHSHAELFLVYQCGSRTIKTIYRFLKQFEPLGVGAENSWQALQWQAEQFYQGDELLQEILHTLQLSRNDIGELDDATIAQLSQLLFTQETLIRDKLKLLVSLDPYPCRHFKDSRNDFVYPEIEILVKDGVVDIIIKNDLAKQITLNDDLFNKTLPTLKAAEKDLWQNKFNEARNLLISLDYRRASLVSAVKYLIEYQKDFFITGPQAIKPLNLNDIAEKLTVNISTVSRILNHKYLQCQWGIFPVKFFFANRINTSDGSNKTSQNLISDIKKIVEEEDRRTPLSDLQILQALKLKGYDIHRRTVAKYRAQLNIPAAAERRQE